MGAKKRTKKYKHRVSGHYAVRHPKRERKAVKKEFKRYVPGSMHGFFGLR